MKAHQPGSAPIDIPETVPNPAHTPAPAPAPERAPTKVPDEVPEKPSIRATMQSPSWLLSIQLKSRRNLVKERNDRCKVLAPKTDPGASENTTLGERIIPPLLRRPPLCQHRGRGGPGL